jgi:hypothetical protein
MTLIYLIISFIGLLLVYQIYLAFLNKAIIEPMTTNTSPPEYQEYNLNNPNNALILAQQNAGNIEVLKGQIMDLSNTKKDVDDIKSNVDQLTIQVNNLVQQQADYAQEMAGNQPVEVTGTGEMTTEDV